MKELDKETLGKIIAGALFGGLFIYAYVAYFWMPYSKKIADNKVKLEKLEKDISSAKQIKAQFKNLQEKLEQLKIQKAEAEKKLPRDKKLPDLIRTLKSLSDKNSVKILFINPSSSSRDQYFTKVNYSMSVKGKYHDIGRFFAAIALEERILNVEDLVISQLDAAGDSCSVNFNLSAYQYGG
ncbi:MAG: type 4a pilus biogenesis protein PilO [Elusimicrobia bacterium]|nr:type 4a pilus biogenesis protein PilO [Elusimicrobiota bacterium]